MPLEFELFIEHETWQQPPIDLSNEFGMIRVSLPDGRVYSLNVWTYTSFHDALNQEKRFAKEEDEVFNYLQPPDLFVREMSRSCLQDVVSRMLQTGELDTLGTIPRFDIAYKTPWIEVGKSEKVHDFLLEELDRELHTQHPLYGQKVIEILAKRLDNGELLLKLEKEVLAVVDLTWSHQKETGPLPACTFYANKRQFWKERLRPDILGHLSK